MWDDISKKISESIGQSFQIAKRQNIGGGCINSAYLLSDGQRQFFVKTNEITKAEMFQAETDGLLEIVKSKSIRVPRPLCVGTTSHHAFVVMEYIRFGGASATPAKHKQLGIDLAKMHCTTQLEYGWIKDNTIGSTPQINTLGGDWVSFWRDKRLGYQLELAASKGYGGRLQQKGAKLMSNLGAFFSAYTPVASLLHGDLWSGNYAFDEFGAPVIFDPAVYFGDRETDLAMTELFAGFSADFYSAYAECYPLHCDYAIRKTLYNVYHILNHLNLFGSGYLSQAENMIDRLLSEVG